MSAAVLRFARDERADFVEFLATLSPEQWDAPTLCAGWRVRDVVAHSFAYDGLSTSELTRRLLAGRMSLGRVNAALVRDAAAEAPADLLATARERLRPRGIVTGFGGRIALIDGLMHHQDVRRPLGQPRVVPADRLVAALSFAPIAVAIGGPLRSRGLTFVATDVDWRRGRGPAVEGPGEALLMAIGGRAAALPDLTGPGVATLAARMPRSAA